MGLFRTATTSSARSTGEILVEMGLITPAQSNLPPEEIKKLVGEEAYHHALAKKYNKTFIPPSEFQVRKEILSLIHPDWIYAGLVPYEVSRNRLFLATDDPEQVNTAFYNLRNNYKGHEVYLQYVTVPEAIEKAKQLARELQEEERLKRSLPSGLEVRSETPTVEDAFGAGNILLSILEEARAQGASDIHFERALIEGSQVAQGVRLRVGGKLVLHRIYEPVVMDALIAKVKIYAGLKLDERRLPQDGRFTIPLGKGGEKIEGRVSVVGTPRGEEVVIRLLPSEGSIPSLDQIIYDEEVREAYRKVIASPYGIFLVTGPTGSGKSTTLAAMLRETVEKRGGKILSVEDPVEYRLPGMTQVQVQEEIGLTFARVLRAFLRQDPDVIMVGELRDAETAKIATEAALTGHLVLSTLHVNTSIASVRRLEQMGVEMYKIMDSLLGASAQRLIPKLCPSCAVPDDEARAVLGGNPKRPSFNPKCPVCGGRGYKGRVGVQEFFFFSQPIKEAVAKARTEEVVLVIEEALRKGAGFKSMYERGLSLVKSGVIALKDLEEATRVVL
jgi:type IV pilus assembly protein PilB